MSQRYIYPFTAIVGQDNMKKALLLNIINPSLGGVLIKGEKGTAKSTAVRGLAEILPEREQVKECKFSCDPKDISKMCDECKQNIKNGLEVTKGKMKVVDLAISATEDRVVGTLDIEYAIKKGEKKFENGILANANRNILYVDEVNLLDDNIVDILLDSAAMGVNTIEREGISYNHPSSFILIGTMNPEEGDLRPQLLDRFSLVVNVAGEKEYEKRAKVIKQRLKFDKDPEAFIKGENDNKEQLQDKSLRAKELLEQVQIDDSILLKVAKLTTTLQVDGHRADISLIKTAMTLAAFNERNKIIEEDILQASELVLPHRMRRKPFEENEFDFEKVKEIIRS
ncbi:Magnesium-chelatase 38 kDa subunit [bioreactor metagenome]|uniref:Magnesium-chelatase 38 kDa subunit n=1 Tax=bioreactor metagenome TaxID=1076179 RepID=A0A645ACI7_9ZZZZ